MSDVENSDEVALLAWNDLVGLTRGRGVPVSELKSRLKTGINWAYAGQALTPFDAIADNPWGPVGEAYMTPDPASRVRVELGGAVPPLHFYLCDGINPDGTPWDSCTRGFLRQALTDLEREAGLTLAAAAEVEFDLGGTAHQPGPPFSLEAFRAVPEFAAAVVQALREAGAEPETFEPEYGYGQYEISCAPAFGLQGADRMVVVREVVREVARRRGWRASFTPIVRPGVPGNGAHMHFSLWDTAGKPATHDPARPGGLSEKAAAFAAGVVRHTPALCALTAPSVISYLRLGPHHWSSGYAACALSNREASLRIVVPPKGTAEETARRYHLEFRPTDSTCSPYLALGAIVRAGLEGIRAGLALPPLFEGDPHDMGEAKRQELGIVRLPETLEDALQALEADRVAGGWFPPTLLQVFLAVKRKEIELMTHRDPADVCELYRNAY